MGVGTLVVFHVSGTERSNATELVEDLSDPREQWMEKHLELYGTLSSKLRAESDKI